uniref:ER membrane protein complex subunit 6 n=1 Tax=Lotharella oceanica TaxID=641309 RepID=A0A7S2XA63_9EUKA|mmetsp:Transcript_22133/g.41493  ORF Transcript_22133/g.41493 Transcript_22133/m.41493 type:complete len:107 (+) Transcript_22133:111-431(+)
MALETPGELMSTQRIAHNVKVIHFCRILISIVVGAACGIIGYTGIRGFLFFILSWIGTSLSYFVRTGWDTEKYFTSTWLLVTHDLFQGTLSFMLFWTLFYDIVHIY